MPRKGVLHPVEGRIQAQLGDEIHQGKDGIGNGPIVGGDTYPYGLHAVALPWVATGLFVAISCARLGGSSAS